MRLPWPAPPYALIRELVSRYLGPVRRAGAGVLTDGTPGGEAAIFRSAGFTLSHRLELTATEPLVRDVDDIVAWVFSRSDSAPHLFGDRLGEFEAQLRQALHGTAPDDRFTDPPARTEVHIWRKGQG